MPIASHQVSRNGFSPQSLHPSGCKVKWFFYKHLWPVGMEPCFGLAASFPDRWTNTAGIARGDTYRIYRMVFLLIWLLCFHTQKKSHLEPQKKTVFYHNLHISFLASLLVSRFPKQSWWSNVREVYGKRWFGLPSKHHLGFLKVLQSSYPSRNDLAQLTIRWCPRNR